MSRSGFSRRRVLASLGAAPVAAVLATPAPAASTAPAQPPDADEVRTEPVLTALLKVRLQSPAQATVGSAILLGGEVQGELAGIAQPGSLEWTRDPSRGLLHLTLRFELQSAAGARIHVADRASVLATTGCWDAPFTTTPDLTVVDGANAACRQSVYVGRMDARQIESGQLRLAVHRVL